MNREFIDRMGNNFGALLEELGFETIIFNEGKVYKHDDTYLRLTYVKGFEAFAIETAGSEEEAQNNVYEDSDWLSSSLDEDKLLQELRDLLDKYYLPEPPTNTLPAPHP